MTSTSPPPPNIQIITPNDADQTPLHPKATIFLAGPTEIPWRAEFISIFKELCLETTTTTTTSSVNNSITGVTIYDPFQPNWDSTWQEDYARDPKFQKQTDWELDHMDSARIVVFYFHGKPLAPVSLLELGLAARPGLAVVGCEPGYWKRGNVQAVCKRFSLPFKESLNDLVAHVVSSLKV